MLINLNSVNDSPTINQNRGFILTLVPFIQRRFVRNLVVIELHKRIPLSTLQRLNWSFNLWRISFNFDNLLSSMWGRLIGDNRRRCISRDPEICGRNRNLRDKKKKKGNENGWYIDCPWMKLSIVHSSKIFKEWKTGFHWIKISIIFVKIFTQSFFESSWISFSLKF